MRHKLLWDFNIQTDHLISVRHPDLIIINKKENLPNCVLFYIPTDHRVKLKEKEKKYIYLNLSRELKKTKKNVEHENDNYTNCDWCFCDSNRRIIKRTGGRKNKSRSEDHPNNNSIFENGQNTEKSPRDLRRLAVTQNSAKTICLRSCEKLSRSI